MLITHSVIAAWVGCPQKSPHIATSFSHALLITQPRVSNHWKELEPGTTTRWISSSPSLPTQSLEKWCYVGFMTPLSWPLTCVQNNSVMQVRLIAKGVITLCKSEMFGACSAKYIMCLSLSVASWVDFILMFYL